MSAIERFLGRWGFVKLNSYGLVLTPDGRIASLRAPRPEELGGARIVGWKDNDLAALSDHETWSAPVRPMRVAPPLPARVAPVIPMPVALASPSEEPEDDWEWTIALARARATAEEAEMAAQAPVSDRRRRADTVPPPAKTLPLMTVAIPNKTEPLPALPDPTTESFSKTEEIDIEGEPELVRVVRIQDRPHVLPTPALVTRSPVTVIPVPRLPSVTSSTYQPGPVVRSPAPPPVPRRVAKGTGPLTEAMVGETTSVGVAVDPDATRPDLRMPPVTRTRQMPIVAKR